LKLGYSFWCSSTFSLHRLYVFSRLNISWTQTSTNHMVQSLATGFTTLCTPWMSKLKCKPWFTKKDVVGWMNALCCCKQTLPCPKGQTNYFDDNWLCTINKTWLTHFVCPYVWGWKVNDNFTFTPKSSNNCFQNTDANWGPRSKMISSRRPWYQKTWSRNLVVPSLVIVLVHGMKWTIFVK
jgi:hypothetical protein